MGKYYRASKKQMEYIALLCERLGETNPGLYQQFSVEQAKRLINQLRRRLDKRHGTEQLKLL